MAYNSQGNYGLSPTQYGIAGAASGFVTRVVTQPLDVIKIRFQLQVESTYGKQRGKYYSVFQAFKTIKSHEGLAALWKGHVPCQLLTVSYGSGQFFCYYLCTKAYKNHNNELKGMAQMGCGGVAGMFGTLISMPFDIARTRLIAQSKNKYQGTLSVWQEMYGKTGITSLWRGLTPTLCMVAPAAAIQFRVYNLLNEYLSVNTNEFVGVWASMFSGGVAGLTAKLAVYPLDVLKKRLQILGSEDLRQSFGKVVQYGSPLDCIKTVTLEEGITGWYKGVIPSLIKSCIYSSLVFAFFEMSCQYIVEYDKRNENQKRS